MKMADGWNWFRIFPNADFDIRCVETSGSFCIVLVIFDRVYVEQYSSLQIELGSDLLDVLHNIT
jgi:hypothetical protein